MSRTITSNCASATARSASHPVAALVMEQQSLDRIIPKKRWMAGSSSTMRIRGKSGCCAGRFLTTKELVIVNALASRPPIAKQFRYLAAARYLRCAIGRSHDRAALNNALLVLYCARYYLGTLRRP